MNRMNLNFPFSKVNREERTISGVATANNIDQSGDIVSPDASFRAFQRWVGNVREMHNKQAVGKAINISQVDVFDDSGEKYLGLEVTAYISKGAEDTWQKVLDGTLRGYSIGGVITSKEYKYIPELDKNVRVITGYELNELSLVDNPDNPLATLSMVKLADFDLDMQKYADIKMYVCKACNKGSMLMKDCCPECGGPMEEMDCMDSESGGYSEDGEDDEEEYDEEDDNELEKVDSYVPPQSVRAEAARGLELRREFNRGGTSIGVARARDLSNGKGISLSTIRRMVSYFARHEVDKQGQGWNQGEEGYPSAGKIAWLLWGGDAGRAWANKISRQAESDASKSYDREIIAKDLHKNENNDRIGIMEDLTKDQKRNIFAKFINLFVEDKEVEELITSAENTIDKSIDTRVEVESNESTEYIENNGGNEVDLSEVLDKLSAKLDEGFDKAKGEIASTLSAEIDAKIEAKLNDFAKSVDEKFSASVAEVSERVEKVESSGAFRKSAETEEIEEEIIEKSIQGESFWNNLLLPQPLIEALGYES